MAKKVEAARNTQRATPPEGEARRWAAAKAELDKEVVMVDKMQDNIKELEMMAEHATQDAQEAREVAHVESMPPDMRENVEAFYNLLTDKAEQTAAFYRETARRLNQVIEGTSEAVKLSVKAFTPLMQSFAEHAEELREVSEMWRLLGPYIDAETKEHPEIYGDDEHPDVGADVPLEVLIAAAAKRARADGVDVPTLAAEQAAAALIVRNAIFTPGNSALSFSGEVLSILAQARTRGKVDRFGDTLSVNDFLIASETAKTIGIGEAKLLRYGVSAFTKINAQNSKNIKLRIYADTKEFARACGVRIDRKLMDTPEEQIAEDKRANKALENFVSKLGRNAKNLLKASFTGTEKVRQKPYSHSGLNLIGAYKITRDSIMLEFTQTAAEYMVKLALIEVPSAYYAIDDRKPNAFAIAEALIRHYSINNNVVRNTERIIQIRTLLKHTSFPSKEEIEEKRNSWVKLVKIPFEEAMDELYQKGLIAEEKVDPATGKHISGGWHYSLAGMKELSDEQARAIIEKGYSQFVSLYVVFELAGYESHEVRAKAIADKKSMEIKEMEKRGRKPRAKTSRKTAAEKTDGSADGNSQP